MFISETTVSSSSSPTSTAGDFFVSSISSVIDYTLQYTIAVLHFEKSS